MEILILLETMVIKCIYYYAMTSVINPVSTDTSSSFWDQIIEQWFHVHSSRTLNNLGKMIIINVLFESHQLLLILFSNLTDVTSSYTLSSRNLTICRYSTLYLKCSFSTPNCSLCWRDEMRAIKETNVFFQPIKQRLFKWTAIFWVLVTCNK